MESTQHAHGWEKVPAGTSIAADVCGVQSWVPEIERCMADGMAKHLRPMVCCPAARLFEPRQAPMLSRRAGLIKIGCFCLDAADRPPNQKQHVSRLHKFINSGFQGAIESKFMQLSFAIAIKVGVVLKVPPNATAVDVGAESVGVVLVCSWFSIGLELVQHRTDSSSVLRDCVFGKRGRSYLLMGRFMIWGNRLAASSLQI